MGRVRTSPEASPLAESVRESVRAQRTRLLALVRRFGGPTLDAEEVLHGAIERALAKSDQVRAPLRVEAWLARVVRNAVIDEARRRRARPLSIDDVPLAAVGDDDVGCACVLVQAGQLRPEYAEILRRVVVEGVPVSDVARALGLTPNNAMVRLHRARKALKNRLQAHCGTTTMRACLDCGCEERGCCPPP